MFHAANNLTSGMLISVREHAGDNTLSLKQLRHASPNSVYSVLQKLRKPMNVRCRALQGQCKHQMREMATCVDSDFIISRIQDMSIYRHI